MIRTVLAVVLTIKPTLVQNCSHSTINRQMNTLQVEQLQEDIITIMESHFPNENVDEVISLLCDAVTYTFNDSDEDDLPEPDESTGWN